jgi:hypothetical protein
MYQPTEVARIAMEDIRRVARNRISYLLGIGGQVRTAESGGTSPSIRLEVRYRDEEGWTEYIESSCRRGAHAFDREFLDSLVSQGWVVLHYPRSLINEEFGRLKAEELRDLAISSGLPRPEVWVYLYDWEGLESRVV